MSEPEGQEGLQLPGVGFRAVRGGGASARFAPAEAMLLRNLAAQVAELVGGEQPLAGQAPAAGARPASRRPARDPKSRRRPGTSQRTGG